MPERVDPRNLPSGYSPAFIQLSDGLVCVADATVRDSGWLEFTEWSGTTGLVPPRDCGRVKFIATEHVDDELRRRIADADIRAEYGPKAEVSR
ncbi:hypothetical protein C483_15042 [Natrialba hulunbeirensis JCM 10989]|uniref:Uncharacterized protein n=1 Tax=Natrialba hulunbeirensis JCM 10989 TaxID=1227493 RepID=L9ZQ87_9EURY|nr:hypothetical protein [Natrialba hulunbeirensis]ELY88665.1 hypothetical protein C483_15042 [Natrialba hulunbeirensis JCM 10989]